MIVDGKGGNKRFFDGGFKELIKEGGYLNIGSAQGELVISYMKNHEEFDSSRGLLLYHWDSERIRCIDQIPRSPEKGPNALPPYAIFLEGQHHFCAMSEPEKTSSE